jgi:hypothetical protein
MNDFDPRASTRKAILNQQLDELIFMSNSLEDYEQAHKQNLLPLDNLLLAKRLDEIWPLVQQERAEAQDVIQAQRSEKIDQLRSSFEAAFIRDFGIKFWTDCSKADAVYFLSENEEKLIWAIPVRPGQTFNLFYSSFYEGLSDKRGMWSFSTSEELKVNSNYGFHPITYREAEDKTLAIQKWMARVRHDCLED